MSHNRSLIRALATRIWNSDDGVIETYPGTLDEYMPSCRLRLEAEARRTTGDDEPARAAQGAPAPAPGKTTRADERARKRREAQLRQQRSVRLGPIQKRIDSLETRIAKLESQQAERSAQLSDAEVYADASRRDQLLSAYQKGADKLEELTARWEGAAEELERAEAELAAE